MVSVLPDALRGVPFQPGGEGYLTHLVGKQADQRVDAQPNNGVRVRLGDLLDLHAALGGEQDQGPLRRPVDRDGEIELPVYLRPALDVDAPDGVAADVHAEDLFGCLPGLPGAAHDLDAAGLAAPAGEDLSLDRHGSPEGLGGPRGLLRRPGDDARQRFESVVPQ